MTPAQSNHHLLDFWAGTYAAFGEAALPPLGLSPADIDAVLTVEPTVLRHWAERSDSIVRPRPGLLPALQTQDQRRIETFLTAADKLTLDRWGQLPIALAEPRPGLLPDLLAREEPQLVAFLDSLQR